jgi:hypothetical protein
VTWPVFLHVVVQRVLLCATGNKLLHGDIMRPMLMLLLTGTALSAFLDRQPLMGTIVQDKYDKGCYYVDGITWKVLLQGNWGPLCRGLFANSSC